MIEAVIAEMKEEAAGIVSLELRNVDGTPLPPFSAGAHIDIHLPGPWLRQYSLWNDPRESHRYCIGVLKDPASRGGSKAVHELKPGQRVQISIPRNLFPLDETASTTLLFAGGIGITPILSMAQHLHNLGAPFEMHYCIRSPDRAAFLEMLKSSPFSDKLHLHFDEGHVDQKLNAAEVLSKPSGDRHLYVCGPSGFMNFVLSTAKECGWLESNLHREYFSAEPLETGPSESFEIEIASSGVVLTVGADQTVVQALENAGIEVPVSCEQGICGTCITRVLQGTPDHRDLFMTDAEHNKNDQFTPCCSRSLSPRLVLDL